jgi:hypothetical protein
LPLRGRTVLQPADADAMTDAAAPVALSRLVHDVAQETYKDMHATMDTLGDAELDVRRAKMLDYAMRTRHRIVRLLASVQWWGDYSAFHCSATEVRDASAARAADFENAADSLWSCAQAVRGASAAAPSLTAAAHLLGGSSLFQCLPQLIENVIGLHLPDLPSVTLQSWNDGDDSIMRLGTATRELVRTVLPVGCSVLAWRAAPGDAAVKVGIRGAWDADVIVDRLERDEALLRVLRVTVQVGSDADAVGPLRRSSLAGTSSDRTNELQRSLFSAEEEQRLRALLEERMFWAGSGEQAGYAAVDRLVASGSVPPNPRGDDVLGSADGSNPLRLNNSNTDGGAEPQSGVRTEAEHILRARRMLLALHDCLTHDVAGVFAMEHVRAQASVLQLHSMWRKSNLTAEGTSKSADPRSNVVMTYWSGTVSSASITIAPTTYVERDGTARVVDVKHDPPVLGVEFPQLCLSSVNVETLLLGSMQLRAREILLEVATLCEMRRLTVCNRNVVCDAGRCTIAFALCERGGVEVSIVIPSRALRLRAYGDCASCYAYCHDQPPLGAVDEPAHRTVVEMQKHIETFIRAVKHSTVSCRLLRNGRAGDLAVLSRCPPGMASAEDIRLALEGTPLSKLPPLALLEHFRPSSFLSLRCVDSAAAATLRRSRAPVAIATETFTDEETSVPAEGPAIVSERSWKRMATPDGLLFVQGKRPRLSTLEEGDATQSTSPGVYAAGDDLTNATCVAKANMVSFCVGASLLMRREMLLEALHTRGVVTSVLDNSDNVRLGLYRTAVSVSANPLPVSSAELRLGRNEEWQLTLTLLTNVWDTSTEIDLCGSVSYRSSTRELSFKYAALTAASIDECASDLSRTKSLAAIGDELSAFESKAFELERVTPTLILLLVGSLQVSVAGNTKGYTVTIGSSKSVMQQLARLMEEVINAKGMLQASGDSAGAALGALLEQACPLADAIDFSVPESTGYCNVLLMMCLRARISVVGKSGAKHIVDIDARQRQGVMIIDFARALALKSAAEGRDDRFKDQRASAVLMNFQPVPKWESLLRELVNSRRGKEYHSGAAILVAMTTLGRVLRVLVEACRRGV